MPQIIDCSHIALYLEYDGNFNLYERERPSKARELAAPWGAIDNLCQRLTVVMTGQAGERYKASVDDDLGKWAADDEVRSAIRAIARRAVDRLRPNDASN
jgi:hypothetical protein